MNQETGPETHRPETLFPPHYCKELEVTQQMVCLIPRPCCGASGTLGPRLHGSTVGVHGWVEPSKLEIIKSRDKAGIGVRRWAER